MERHASFSPISVLGGKKYSLNIDKQHSLNNPLLNGVVKDSFNT